MAKIFGPKTLIFTGTASHRGRSISVSPENSAMEHLHFGRILLDSSANRVDFGTDGREMALLCMRGAVNVQPGFDQSGSGLEASQHGAAGQE